MGRPPTLAGALMAPLFLLLALTGCGGTTSVADPPVSPPATSSSAPAPPKRESPAHFIRRFVSISNAMEMAGDTARFLALTRNCRTCQLLARQISKARASGGFYHSKGWRVKRLRPDIKGDSGGIDIDVMSASTSFKMSASSAVRHYSGGSLIFRLDVRRLGASWRVTNVLQVAQ